MFLDKKLKKYSDHIAWFLVLIFAAIYSFMTINNLRLFEIMGWDLGVFDQGVWQWSRLMIPYSTFHELPWLADHFHLILVSLAPFYWVWPNVRVLLIAQAVLTSFGALPLYFLSKRINKDSYLFNIAIVLGYLLYFSLQWHTFSGFHELAFLPITFGFVMYFWETRKTKFYWLAAILALLIKEEIGLLLAAFGLWALLKDRERWKQAVATIVLGLLTTFGLILLIMPAIGGGVYLHSGFGAIGNTPLEVLTTIAKNPFILLRVFFDSPVKIRTMFTNFWPWGFLPLFSPSTLLLAVQQYLVRFIDYGKTIRWTPFYAYSLPLATITTWSCIYGFRNLMVIAKRKMAKKSRYFGLGIALIIIVLTLASQIVLHAPVNSIFKKAFYRSEKWMEDNRRVVSCVPPGVSVSAQNSLAPWLSQRKEITVFPEGLSRGYEYIVVDLHQGQSENSFYFLGSEKTKFLINDLVKRKLYQPVCEFGEAMVLKKIADTTGKLKYPFPLDIYER